MAYKNCFFIDTYSAFDAAAVLPSLDSFSNLGGWFTLPPTDSMIEIVLENKIKVYGDANPMRQISDLVVAYSLI